MRYLVSFALLCTSGTVLAHGLETHEDSHPLAIGASGSLTWNNQGAADANGYWRIPGALMGGDAEPANKDTTLNDALLWGRYRITPRTSLHGKLGTQAGGTSSHHNGINVENAYIRHQFTDKHAITGSIGKLEANFSPSAASHASTSTFAEAPLVADTFWGRSIHDKGAQLSAKPNKQTEIGIEAWQGDFFPATQDKSARDLYLKFTPEPRGDWQVQAGAWAMRADAKQRGDARYNDGHVHSGSLLAQPKDVRFSGRTDLSGVWLNVNTPKLGKLQPNLQYEIVQSKADGVLTEASPARTANYQNDYVGYTLTPQLSKGRGTVSYRHEELVLDNHLSGAAAQVLAQDANLISSKNPKRQTLQFKWQATPQWAWRVSYTRDHTLDKADSRVGVGLVWQDTLYQR